MNITQPLRKWGNGTGIRLPKQVLEAAHLHLDQEVEVTMDGQSIVLTPLKPARVTLDEFLKDATPENIGGEYDWGEDVGLERWYDD